MNILLINHYAGSPKHGMEFRPYHLAREWVGAGHRVMIVGATQSHVRRMQPGAGDETIDGIAYRWLQTPRYRGNGVGRVLNIGVFLARLALQRWPFIPDVVIASSTYPMDIWVARRIAREHRAKLVHEIHDLWPASPVELAGLSPRHPFIRLVQRAENDACRDADVVVSMLPKVHEHLRAHGLDLAKLHIVGNGVAPQDWQEPHAPLDATITAHIESERAAGRRVVVYAGSHGEPNALGVLIDAARLLRDEPFAFVLVGDGHEKARLMLQASGLDRVRFLAPIPKAQVPALLHAAHIGYLGWQRKPLYRYGIAPNKLYDYLMAGLPVLHSVEAGNDPVAEAAAGISVAPESPQAVADGLRRLAATSASERRAMGERGRAFVQAHHTWPVLARRFLDAMS